MLQNVLHRILDHKAREVASSKAKHPLSAVRALAESQSPALDFAAALSAPGGARVIAECKRQSPSRGLIRADYDPATLAAALERGGAAAISVLTDADFFGGSLTDLHVVAENVSLPILRKDFVIDEYQIFEARAWGADSFLLLAGVLDTAQLQYFIEIGRDLGMEALVESHTSADLDLALKTDARILGINNRNLDTFAVNLDTAATLARRITKAERIAVCESGIHSGIDIERMRSVGYNAFLIGEALMSQSDVEQTLKSMLAPLHA